MTVKELIEKLNQMPQDLPVYDYEYVLLTEVHVDDDRGVVIE